MTSRLPDFLIIGAAKSGTTSLFRWLAAQPECDLPRVKEPNFFSDDAVWDKGLSWYASLFAAVPPDRLTGEASIAYTDPRLASTAADRIVATVPGARLIYIVRDPIERLRSHYQHDVQRGRDRRSLDEVITDPDDPAIGFSLYFTCLSPYIERFDRDQLCVVRLEDVVGAEATGWHAVLRHLGLPPRPLPATAYNVAETKRQFTPALRWSWERGWTRHARGLPAPVRRAAAKVLMRDGPGDGQQTESPTTIPPEVSDRIWADVARLEDWLGTGPLWER